MSTLRWRRTSVQGRPAVHGEASRDRPGSQDGETVLVNSIGGATLTSEGLLRTMSEPSLGDWGVHFGAEDGLRDGWVA